MTQSSNLGYYVPIAAEALAEYHPASAAHAWLIRNNLLHIKDELAQTRLSWSRMLADTRSTLQLNTAWAGGKAVWCMPFVHTWLDHETPLNLITRISFSTPDTADYDVTVRVIPHFRRYEVPFAAGSSEATELSILLDTGNSYSGPTTAEEISEQEEFGSDEAEITRQILLINFNGQLGRTYAEIGASDRPQIYGHVMRFEVIVESDDELDFVLNRAIVREYAYT